MAGLVDSYKKVYENKKAHVLLLLISLIWTLLSSFWDIKTGNVDSYKQNPIDLIFNIIIGAYSIQFLHNALNNINGGILPSFKDICGKIFLGMIKLNIVWGLYAVVVLAFAAFAYMMTHVLAIFIILVAALLFLAIFVYYIYLAYAENLDTKGLANIKLLFQFVKPGFKNIYIKLILFILFTAAAAAVCILIYITAGLTGIDKIGEIAKDFYLIDVITNTFVGYFVIVTWYFAFPYSLINSYIKNIRPLIRKDKNNDTND